MLLTCNHCIITYDMDDRAYAQQGYAICERCQGELVPLDGGFQSPGQAQGQDAQWGQPAQGFAQDAQWGQPAQGFAQDAQWGQPAQGFAQDAQWGQPAQGFAQDAQWGQPAQGFAQDAQWGQAAQDAQWGQPAQNYGQDAQWGQPAQGLSQEVQWGQEPQNYAQDAQWGQAAQNYGQDAQWDQGQGPVLGHGNQQANGGERTVALDLSDFNADEHQPQGNWNNAEAEEAQWGEAWGSSGPSVPQPMSLLSPTPERRRPTGQQVVVGAAVDPAINEGMTRQIDLRDVQMLYGDKPQHVKNFIQSLPRMAIYVAGGVLAISLVLFVVLAVIIATPDEKERVVGTDGEVVEKGTPAPPRSFREIVESTKVEIPTIMPLDGPELRDGVIVGISARTGVSYNERKIVPLDAIQSGPRFVEPIYETVRMDLDGIDKPIVLLFDETLQMSTVFRVMYSIAATGRKVLLGASTPTGITALDIDPFEWPDYGTYMFPSVPNVTTQLKITTADLVMRVILGTDPLIVEADGTALLELRDEIRGGKVVFQNIQPAISKMRAAQRPSMRITTDGDVPVGTFMRVAFVILGSLENPNVKKLLLDEVPLR